MSNKNILVLGRRDHTEAMRVAAGLTLLGHEVRLVFMTGPVAETPENVEQIEIVELSDVPMETTVAAMSDDLTLLSPSVLSEAIFSSDHVINI